MNWAQIQVETFLLQKQLLFKSVMIVIEQPVFPGGLGQIKKRQKHLKQLIDQYSQHRSTKVCKKLKFRQQFFKIGDFVLISATKDQRYVCRIAKIFVLPKKIQAIPIVELQWCLQKHDFAKINIPTEDISEYEVFPSNRRVCQYVNAIIKKCDVFTLDEFLCLQYGNKNYFFSRAQFNVLTMSFVPAMAEWKRACLCDTIPVPGQNGKQYIFCRKCDKVFHRKCVKLSEKSVFYCAECSGQVKNPVPSMNLVQNLGNEMEEQMQEIVPQ